MLAGTRVLWSAVAGIRNNEKGLIKTVLVCEGGRRRAVLIVVRRHNDSEVDKMNSAILTGSGDIMERIASHDSACGHGTVSLVENDIDKPMKISGLSKVEGDGRWSIGARVSMALTLPTATAKHVLLFISIRPFLAAGRLPEQRVVITANGVEVGDWNLQDTMMRLRALFIDRTIAGDDGVVNLELTIETCRSPASLGLNNDQRELGVFLRDLSWRFVDAKPPADDLIWQVGRPVGEEARKTYDERILSGFWAKYVGGPKILDIGFRGKVGGRIAVPIMDGAIGVDLDYPGYDGKTLPFATDSQDVVYSSHCLEHIPGHVIAIQEWHRVTKPGGHVIIAVPHAHLYERSRRPPSAHNRGHYRFYTPASLLSEIESALVPNTYRIRFMEENDRNYDYTSPTDQHPRGCYEIVVVLQKISQPAWTLPA